MPVFEFAYNIPAIQGQSPISPANALQFLGPIIPVQIAVPSALEQQLKRENQLVPPPMAGDALIDTGASISAVDDSVIRTLGVAPISLANVGTGADRANRMFIPQDSFCLILDLGLNSAGSLEVIYHPRES